MSPYPPLNADGKANMTSASCASPTDWPIHGGNNQVHAFSLGYSLFLERAGNIVHIIVRSAQGNNASGVIPRIAHRITACSAHPTRTRLLHVHGNERGQP